MPSDPRADAIEDVADYIDSLPKYYAVECQHCPWAVVTWTEREAGIRGRVHEERTDGHRVDMVPALADASQPTALGFPEDETDE